MAKGNKHELMTQHPPEIALVMQLCLILDMHNHYKRWSPETIYTDNKKNTPSLYIFEGYYHPLTYVNYILFLTTFLSYRLLQSLCLG